MYHFFFLNSKIVIDFPERYVLEPTVPDLQLEVRYAGGRKGVAGSGGRKEWNLHFGCSDGTKNPLKELSSVLLALSVSEMIVIICVSGHYMAL